MTTTEDVLVAPENKEDKPSPFLSSIRVRLLAWFVLFLAVATAAVGVAYHHSRADPWLGSFQIVVCEMQAMLEPQQQRRGVGDSDGSGRSERV